MPKRALKHLKSEDPRGSRGAKEKRGEYGQVRFSDASVLSGLHEST